MGLMDEMAPFLFHPSREMMCLCLPAGISHTILAVMLLASVAGGLDGRAVMMGCCFHGTSRVL